LRSSINLAISLRKKRLFFAGHCKFNEIAQIRVRSAAPVVTIYKSAPLPHEASRKCSHIKESTYA